MRGGAGGLGGGIAFGCRVEALVCVRTFFCIVGALMVLGARFFVRFSHLELPPWDVKCSASQQ